MLFQPRENIEELSIRLLGQKPGQTAQALHASLLRNGKHCTPQAVYKELTKLISHGVVIKEGGRYSLKGSWIFELRSFSENLYRHFLSSSSTNLLLPSERQTHRWKFRTLIEADDFWGHLLVVLLRKTRSKILFESVAYPWFELIHQHKEHLFRSTLRLLGKKIYMIVADDSFLTRHCLKFWTSEISVVSTAPGPFNSPQGRIIDVIDDFVLEISFPIKLQREIADFFKGVNNLNEFGAGALFNILRRPSDITLKLRHNAKAAGSLRRKFADYFGITRATLDEV